MTWVGWLNILLLQWFTLRLGRRRNGQGEHVGWDLLAGVVPLTGWGRPMRDYRYIPYLGRPVCWIAGYHRWDLESWEEVTQIITERCWRCGKVRRRIPK